MKMILKTEKLEEIIEVKYHKFLKKDEYEVLDIPAIKLLHRDRLDLAFKLLYLKNSDSYFARLCYFEHIKSFTNGTFIEHGNSDKNSFEKFLSEFELIIKDLSINGFDYRRSIILISKEGVILNGSHRVAAAIYLGVNVKVIKLDVEHPKYNADFFTKKLTPQEFIYAALIEYSTHKKDLRTAIIWPNGTDKGIEYSEIPNILHVQELDLNLLGIMSIVINVYRDEKWLGDKRNGYLGALNKAKACYVANTKTKIVLFEKNEKQDLVKLKEKLRKRVGVSKHSIHMTDEYKETLDVNQLFLNCNLQALLNSGVVGELLDLNKILKEKYKITFKSISNIILGPYYYNYIFKTQLNRNIQFLIGEVSLESIYIEHALSIGDKAVKELVANPSYRIKLFGVSLISWEGLQYLNKCDFVKIDLREGVLIKISKKVSKIKRALFYKILLAKSELKSLLRNVYHFILSLNQ